jgi:HAD superfamily hydrolase (TIGR01549 family)
MAEALLFDLDATLLDYDDAAYARTVGRVCTALAASQPGLDRGRLVEAHLVINRQRWQVPAGRLVQTSNGQIDGQSIWREIWQQSLAACGWTDGALADLALDLYERDRHASYRLFDDVGDLLNALYGRVPLGVVTNGPGDTQRDKLQATGIERYFEAIVVSGEAGVAKPDAAAFHLALDQLGIEPSSAWHVGDSLALDVAGAHNAGLKSVWLNRTGVIRGDEHPVPHHEITSLQELTALLSEEG